MHWKGYLRTVQCWRGLWWVESTVLNKNQKLQISVSCLAGNNVKQSTTGYRVSLKNALFRDWHPRRSIRMKISPKHCKILVIWVLKFCDSCLYGCSWLGFVSMRYASTKPEEQWWFKQMKILIIFKNMCQLKKLIIWLILRIKRM